MNPNVPNVRWTLPDEVYQAEGVLSVRLGVTLDEAERVLEDRATVGGITVTDAAGHVLADLARTAPTGPPELWEGR